MNAIRANSRWAKLVLYLLAGILLLLAAALAIPNFVPAREVISRSSCIANLKQIEGAKATWALEWKKTPTDVPTDTELFGNDAYIGQKPTCPQGGAYAIGSVGQKVTCTIGGVGHKLEP